MTTATPTRNRYMIPRVNIIENDECVYIEAELPGVSKENLTIEVKEGELTLTGRRNGNSPQGTCVMRERPMADFRRVFALSNVIDTSRVEAELHDGLLMITLHKTDRVKPRKIVVN